MHIGKISAALLLYLSIPLTPYAPFPLSLRSPLPLPPSVAHTRAQQYPQLPSETPARLQRPSADSDHERRDVMIPMRDGVKLHTVILVPKGARRAPILLTRTPYDATSLPLHAPSTHLASVLQGYDHADDVLVEADYIRRVPDLRGK